MTDASFDVAPCAAMASTPRHLLRWPEVKPMVAGISRRTWLRLIKQGLAPGAIQVSPNRSGWLASDIAAFQTQRADARPRATVSPMTKSAA